MTARTKRVITTVTKQSDDQQDLVAALRGLGVSDARIKLFRYANYPARPEYIDDVEIEIVTTGSLEQFLKEKYGSGSYLARGFANGQWVKDGSRVVHIFGEKKEDNHAGKNGAGDSDMWKFLMTQQQASTDRLMALMQNSNQTMMQVFSAIIGSTKPLDLGGVAALMASMKPAGTMKETLEMVTTVVDLTAKISGGGGAPEPADPMMMMLGAGLDLIKNRSLPASTAPPQQPAAPGAPPPAPNPPPQQQQRPAVDYEQQVLADRLRFLEQLKAKARLGKPADEWADYIEDNQDEAVCVWLLSMVRQFPWETIAGALAQTDPELAVEPFQKWFHELYDLLAGGGDDDGTDSKNNSTG